jgi:hypothetical protein
MDEGAEVGSVVAYLRDMKKKFGFVISSAILR